MALWYCGTVDCGHCGIVLFMFYSVVFAEKQKRGASVVLGVGEAGEAGRD